MVQVGDDKLHVIVGDVCGHGVDEAALGVELRVAWRALVLAGVPDEHVLAALEQVLMSERRAREIFATVASVIVDLAGNRATVRLAGHPPPILLAGDRRRPVDAPYRHRARRPARRPPPATDVEFAGDELVPADVHRRAHRGARRRSADERLDVDGLCALLDEPAATRPYRCPRCRPGWSAGPSRPTAGRSPTTWRCC